MVEQVYDSPVIYRIIIPIPDNPLKNLNSYVVMNGEKPLIIDTGFNRQECRYALLDGLRELHLNAQDCTLFLTHLHSDHCGLAPIFAEAGAEIKMGSIDWEFLGVRTAQDGWKCLEKMFLRHGFPPEELKKQGKGNHARIYSPGYQFQATLMTDGEEFELGGLRFRCIWTPGHTPGHMCLYMPQQKLLFTGDHVLYTITPNISPWEGVPDSLNDYLESLDKISGLEVVRGFPAHREEGRFYRRVCAIQQHHIMRLKELWGLVQRYPGRTAYELAQEMTWSVRGRKWTEFPPNQKWFATGETIAHLNSLVSEARIVYQESNGLLRAEAITGSGD